MLDFFKDMYLEAIGLDPSKVQDEKKVKREEENKNHFVKKKTKQYIIAAALLFILIHALSLVISFSSGSVPEIIKSIIMILLTAVCVICFFVGTKRTEAIGIAIIVVVVILSFLIPYI